MTTIKFTYRPFSSSLTVWNDDLDCELTDDECDNLDKVFVDAPEDGEWHISFSTLDRAGTHYFHSMTALDAAENGAGWNLYLSKYLPDEVIESIYARVTEWDNTPIADNLRAKVLANYADSITVSDDSVIYYPPPS